MAASLSLMNSPEDAWENVVRPWFERIAGRGLQNQAAAVVTASRSQAYFFRAQLLAEGKSLLHESGDRDYSTPIWTLVMFDAFMRNVMGDSVASDARDETQVAA